MFKTSYTQSELDEIIESTKQREGWDFSSMNVERQAVPWHYTEIIKEYLRDEDELLDIGTGGGERVLNLAGHCKKIVGIDNDPQMIKTATLNGKPYTNVEFYIDTEKLENTNSTFDVILNRHAPFDLEAIKSKLKPDGYFITQQVGENNMLSIKQALEQPIEEPELTSDMLEKVFSKVIAKMEYDVEYVVNDVESLIFWLQALDMQHSDMEGVRGVANENVFNKILKDNVDKRGFITNEHRYLYIAMA